MGDQGTTGGWAGVPHRDGGIGLAWGPGIGLDRELRPLVGQVWSWGSGQQALSHLAGDSESGLSSVATTTGSMARVGPAALFLLFLSPRGQSSDPSLPLD